MKIVIELNGYHADEASEIAECTTQHWKLVCDNPVECSIQHAVEDAISQHVCRVRGELIGAQRWAAKKRESKAATGATAGPLHG